jgi:dihydropyrimidinase
MDLDLIIKNGVVATAADVGKYDIGVKDGKIAVLAPSISPEGFPGARVIDAEGGIVTVSERFCWTFDE